MSPILQRRIKVKKVGYFFLGFVPFLITFVFQYLSVFFMMGVSMLCTISDIPEGVYPMSVWYNIWIDTDFNTVIMIIYALDCICMFGIWYYWRLGGEYFPNPKKTFHPLLFGAVAVLVPGAQMVCGYISSFLGTLVPSWLEQYEELLEMAGLSDDISALMLIYSVILAPIGEELVFRGVTLRIFRKALPFWAANIMQAVLFGIFHGNWLQGFYAGALGLLLGYICEGCGSIYYSIFLHFLFNFWGTVISSLITVEEGSTAEMVYFVVMNILMIVSIGVGAFLLHLGLEKREEKIKRLQSATAYH